MRRLFERAREKDNGTAMVLVAMSMVLLLGMAAFGTDLAWFYLNASRVQRAADAAALGGVVWLPNDTIAADNTAFATATQNGYEDGVDQAVVDPHPVTGEPNQLEVSVTDTVRTFFLGALGFDDMTIERSAVAEYIPPLKLGSPAGLFGNNCDPTQAGCIEPGQLLGQHPRMVYRHRHG